MSSSARAKTRVITACYRLYLVEDDDLTRQYLLKILTADPSLEVVGHSTTLAHALTHAAASGADVFLLDLGLPDGTCEPLIRQLARELPDSVRLMLTLFDDEAHVVHALEAGANGYLLKHSNSQQILQSVHSVLAGQTPISPGIARYLLKYWQSITPGTLVLHDPTTPALPLNTPLPSPHNTPRNPEPAAPQGRDTTPSTIPPPQPAHADLTDKERQVLELISSGKRNAEIAEQLGKSAHTIHTHVRTIYRKLHINSRVEAMQLSPAVKPEKK